MVLWNQPLWWDWRNTSTEELTSTYHGGSSGELRANSIWRKYTSWRTTGDKCLYLGKKGDIERSRQDRCLSFKCQIHYISYYQPIKKICLGMTWIHGRNYWRQQEYLSAGEADINWGYVPPISMIFWDARHLNCRLRPSKPSVSIISTKLVNWWCIENNEFSW